MYVIRGRCHIDDLVMFSFSKLKHHITLKYIVCHKLSIDQNFLWCPRGTCLWFQGMKHTKNWYTELTKKRQLEQTYYKDFFPGVTSEIRNVQKLGELDWGNYYSFISFCENKAFVLNLFMQFAHSDNRLLPMHVTSKRLWHTTTSSPFPKY